MRWGKRTAGLPDRPPWHGAGTSGGTRTRGSAGRERKGWRVGRYGAAGPPAPGTGKAPVARRVISP